MGLLDSLVGSVVSSALGGGQQGGGQAAMIQAVIGMLTGGGNQQAGAAGGGLGGLGGLLQQFQQGGLGDIASSWVSTGQNLPITPDQVTNVLGSDVLGQLAGAAGMDHSTAASHLSEILPQLVNHLTPQGQLPAQGADLSSMLPQILGSLMGR